ncbi:hypothetical protein [Candidatus Albibeggiatoa sp. nov. NOAA]|uniref:hypothetical protein n=1 Tax=Candidatus Albibeggiatoa sp. nov. NOAA TaxID=3162724 RepID=UPI0032FB65BC|nr:hypothetical protein [Thiotrichaceae bacterium]
MKKTEITLQIPPSEIAKYQWGNAIVSFFFVPTAIYLSYFIFLQEIGFHTKLIYFGFIIAFGFLLIQEKKDAKAIASEQLVLNEEGLRYYSGQSKQDNNWRVTWDSIKFIEIKLDPTYTTDVKLSVHTRTQKKPYETSIFNWVDSETLSEEHINLFKRKTEKLHIRLKTYPYIQEEFYEILNCTPLYQYFLQNNISVKLPDAKNFTHVSPFIIPVVIWAIFIIVIFFLLLISPFH